jgi:hypothetical protein
VSSWDGEALVPACHDDDGKIPCLGAAAFSLCPCVPYLPTTQMPPALPISSKHATHPTLPNRYFSPRQSDPNQTLITTLDDGLSLPCRTEGLACVTGGRS